jgi:16S rRNA processing protein RimM
VQEPDKFSPDDVTELRPEDLRTIGVITGVHGLQGTLRVAPLSDFPERFAALHTVYLQRDETVLGTYQVKRVKWLQAQLLVTLREITKREAAELLRGAELCVLDSETWPLPENVFYVSELIGYAAIAEDGAEIGRLTDVIEGAQDTLIVTMAQGELLVPFVHAWVGEVNSQRRTIQILNWRRLAESDEIPGSPETDDH